MNVDQAICQETDFDNSRTIEAGVLKIQLFIKPTISNLQSGGIDTVLESIPNLEVGGINSVLSEYLNINDGNELLT